MNKRSLFALVAFLVMCVAQAQTGPGTLTPADITDNSSSYTLKTLRALFNDQPVAVANELFGGLHSVDSIGVLNGANQVALSDSMLQTGMLVYVDSANMFFRYKGKSSTAFNGLPSDAELGVYGENTTYWESLDAQILTNLIDTINSMISDSVTVLKDSMIVMRDSLITKIETNSDSITILKDSMIVMMDSLLIIMDATADSVYQGTSSERLDTLNIVGDIFISEGDNTPDTSFVWDGAEWQLLSITDTASYAVYCVTSATADSVQMLSRVVNQAAYRTLLQASDVDTISSTDATGVSFIYPAVWGDFNYSIILDDFKIEMTNGITISHTTVDGVDYKKVHIPSRDREIVIE